MGENAQKVKRQLELRHYNIKQEIDSFTLPPNTWYRDIGGKYSHVEIIVGLHSSDRLELNETIEVEISCHYGSGYQEEILSDKPIYTILENLSRMKIDDAGSAIISLRFEQLSTRHSNEKFVIRISAKDRVDVEAVNAPAISVLSKPSETSRQRQNPGGILDSLKSKPGKRSRGLSCANSSGNLQMDYQAKRSRDEMFPSTYLYTTDPASFFENGGGNSTMKLRGIHQSFPSMPSLSTLAGMVMNESTGLEDGTTIKETIATDLPEVQFSVYNSPRDLSNPSLQFLTSPSSQSTESKAPPIKRSSSTPSLPLPSARLTGTAEPYPTNMSTILSSHASSILPSGSVTVTNMFSASGLFLQNDPQTIEDLPLSLSSTLTENLSSEIIQKIFKVKSLLNAMSWKIDHFTRKRDGTLTPHYNARNPNHLIDEILMLSLEIKEMITKHSIGQTKTSSSSYQLQTTQNLSQHHSPLLAGHGTTPPVSGIFNQDISPPEMGQEKANPMGPSDT